MFNEVLFVDTMCDIIFSTYTYDFTLPSLTDH